MRYNNALKFLKNTSFYMVTKNQIKLINSLQRKKSREDNGLFVAEGYKVISEFLNADYTAEYLFSTQENLFAKNLGVTLVSETELNKISFLTTPNVCLAVFKIAHSSQPKVESNDLQSKTQNPKLNTQNLTPKTQNQIILALDQINDPGNLGTIIRLCDWFGITEIICSENTVDAYNPKVVQSTMGSLARVNILYTDLVSYLQNTDYPVLGTFMEGENIYTTELPSQAILIMGNEANGISETIEDLVTQKISIPRFGDLQQTESLNVATATAICLSEMQRRNFYL